MILTEYNEKLREKTLREEGWENGLAGNILFSFSGQYPEPPGGETTLWGTAPYGQDILLHMKARFTGTCR